MTNCVRVIYITEWDKKKVIMGRLLNSEDDFIEIETGAGRKCKFNKSYVVAIQETSTPFIEMNREVLVDPDRNSFNV